MKIHKVYKDFHKESQYSDINAIIERLNVFRYDDDSSVELSERAKQELDRFFGEYVLMQPDEKIILYAYNSNGELDHYYDHLRQLNSFRISLMEKKYARACRELYDLFRDYPALQSRVYFPVMQVWEKYYEEQR